MSKTNSIIWSQFSHEIQRIHFRFERRVNENVHMTFGANISLGLNVCVHVEKTDTFRWYRFWSSRVRNHIDDYFTWHCTYEMDVVRCLWLTIECFVVIYMMKFHWIEIRRGDWERENELEVTSSWVQSKNLFTPLHSPRDSLRQWHIRVKCNRPEYIISFASIWHRFTCLLITKWPMLLTKA